MELAAQPYLDLADWRRRVGDLYRLSGPDAPQRFRQGRDHLFRTHPQSPLDAPARARFTGLRYFDYDPAYRIRVQAEPADAGDPLEIDTGGEDGVITYRRAALLRFPLGGLEKSQVRALAERYGLAVSAKPDSQDICFVPDGDYAGLVKRLRPETEQPGDIVDLAGQVLGRHRGIVHFTVGQRRGIEIGGQKEPLYVVRIEPEHARIVVGPRRALAVEALCIAGWNWLGENQKNVSVKVRSLAPAVAATRDREWVHFGRAEYGVAPGQAAVLYDGTRLLGGGWIAETIAARVSGIDAAAA